MFWRTTKSLLIGKFFCFLVKQYQALLHSLEHCIMKVCRPFGWIIEILRQLLTCSTNFWDVWTLAQHLSLYVLPNSRIVGLYLYTAQNFVFQVLKYPPGARSNWHFKRTQTEEGKSGPTDSSNQIMYHYRFDIYNWLKWILQELKDSNISHTFSTRMPEHI